MNLISVTFNQPVDVSAAALSIWNESDGQTPVSLDGVAFDYNDQTHQATWDFSSVGDLPSGYYTLSLNAAEMEAADGSALPTDLSFDHQIYIAIPGDANLDGEVDLLNDAFELVGNLGVESGATWQDGDFNGDGAVDLLEDAFLLVGSLDRSVAEPTGFANESENVSTVLVDAPQPLNNLSSGVTEQNGIATLSGGTGDDTFRAGQGSDAHDGGTGLTLSITAKLKRPSRWTCKTATSTLAI